MHLTLSFSIKIFLQMKLMKYQDYSISQRQNEELYLCVILLFQTFIYYFFIIQIQLQYIINFNQIEFFIIQKVNKNNQRKERITSMPFIFHSKKQSIFQVRPSQVETQFYDQDTDNNIKYPQKFKVNIDICRNHPFRTFQKYQEQTINLGKSSPKKEFKNTNAHISSNSSLSKAFKQINQKSDLILDKDLEKFIKTSYQNKLIPNPSKSSLINVQKQRKNQTRENKTFQNTNESQKNNQRLKYSITDTPGPGSYNVFNKSNNLEINRVQNHRLPQKKQKPLEYSIITKQRKQLQTEQDNLFSDCSYKKQNSPVFRQSVWDKKSSKKNQNLLKMLFSNKVKKQNKQVQTSCSSKRQNNQNQKPEDQFQKLNQNSPGPFTYVVKTSFDEANDQKKNKFFITGVPKFFNPQRKIQKFIGPGCYEQKIHLNQNKTVIGPWRQQKHDSNQCTFFSKVPRQLRFDTENLCKNELYYTPKNNMMDQISRHQNRRSKLFFGSSLQRFENSQFQQKDPYKYCFQKQKVLKKSQNCVSMKFKSRRQIFNPIQKSVSPNKYNQTINTLSNQGQKQLFKKLLRSRYQDEVILLKQKKENMQKMLIDEKVRKIDIKTGKKQYENINPDRYKQFLTKKRQNQKQNISFGSDKLFPIKRFTDKVNQLDLNYQTQPNWNIKSFNKYYGYQYAQD